MLSLKKAAELLREIRRSNAAAYAKSPRWVLRARHDAAPLPTSKLLKNLVDIAFNASLQVEEGRSIEFAIGFLQKERSSVAAAFAKPFDQTYELTPATIRRLAPATDAWRTDLAVDLVDGKLRVWGFIDHGTGDLGPNGRTFLPHLVVRAFRPGALQIEYSGQSIYSSIGTEGESVFPFLSAVAQLAASLDVHWSHVLPRFALRIADVMARFRHGGTLILVNCPQPDGIADDYKKYAPPNFILKDAVEELAKQQRSRLEKPTAGDHLDFAAHQKVVEAIEYVARLTCVDGGVILARDFSILGFGAFFKIADDPSKVVFVEPEKKYVGTVSEAGGTRHQQACRWAAKYGAQGVAIIVSQDGPTKIVSGQNGVATIFGPIALRANPNLV